MGSPHCDGEQISQTSLDSDSPRCRTHMKEVGDSHISSMRDACSYHRPADEVVINQRAEIYIHREPKGASLKASGSLFFHLIVLGLVDDSHLGIGRASSFVGTLVGALVAVDGIEKAGLVAHAQGAGYIKMKGKILNFSPCNLLSNKLPC
jgi:hypothetical protein